MTMKKKTNLGSNLNDATLNLYSLIINEKSCFEISTEYQTLQCIFLGQT